MVSASPLHGRGQLLGLEPLLNLGSDGGDALGGDDFAAPGPGPSSPPTVVGAAVQPSTRVREALSAEGENFLEFVTEAIVEKRNGAQPDVYDSKQQEDMIEVYDVTFEELLPPVENNKMIACQGLMMVLALGTKGMLDVQQHEGFGDINLRLTDKAEASHVVEISNGEESEPEGTSNGDVEATGEHMAEEEGGDEGGEGAHFEERFAAGVAAGKESDHDSLYND
jgi:hypothetical protein